MAVNMETVQGGCSHISSIRGCMLNFHQPVWKHAMKFHMINILFLTWHSTTVRKQFPIFNDFFL